jgi:sugar phosphate isomerase/epimerase
MRSPHDSLDPPSVTRRRFLVGGVGALGAMLMPTIAAGRAGPVPRHLFDISLAQWSLHRTIFAGELDHLDFAHAARDHFGIGAVEYVSQFFDDKAKDERYIREMRRRAEDAGVRSLLIMVDRAGDLGHPWGWRRRRAIDRHREWLDAARHLGCHSIRVNAVSAGSWDEQLALAADGIRRLAEHASTLELNVIVENHGGLSSNGHWLSSLIRRVDHPRCGTLPDFGNFRLGDGRVYNRYMGVRQLMRYARGVSAKSHDFNEQGDEIHTDYRRMLRIVLDSGYRGAIGIEYEGKRLSEWEGVRRTKRILEAVRRELLEVNEYD